MDRHFLRDSDQHVLVGFWLGSLEQNLIKIVKVDIEKIVICVFFLMSVFFHYHQILSDRNLNTSKEMGENICPHTEFNKIGLRIWAVKNKVLNTRNKQRIKPSF